MGNKRKSNTELWSGVDHIPEAMRLGGVPENMTLTEFLNHKRVVVKYDPALIKVFGADVVARYEALISKDY